ncbi:putative sulfate/molybdate transporter [Thermosynechococcus sp. QKsg1]|uniref:putative sulfate/molybdate transporter n=1 Tax=unclassified Thermosynechococcus TaxID=2622553 RepID=UPI00122E8774|nr:MULTISPECIES: putative sulfate/molybdate transporter [unclassified Thermosynechococcus]QEQ01551.1 transporter [Thermosynechococcus sp. CL-1]WJI23412.1 putative sulfate/molybdate transporter [Thermosynechococcus sp. B0]WJI25926.1 putative sulfate/molybdate transporter [Thermosynechococcus sp. B1]WKT83037.1 putative sulfate/molybdate transporter [Thermosynechococcus sp. HY596]WNC62164.1 putative sulfate/molybdate transporter [Thermosynechococcus sp. HY591]
MLRERLRFNWQELSGSFGDLGTDLPLLVGMITAAQLDSANVFTLFGVAQILTGVFYGLPMPMQPLKAMAVIVMTEKLTGSILWAGGLMVGAMMLVLTSTGILTRLARWIPQPVVRGCQLGLGLSLAAVALKTYLPAGDLFGYLLGVMGFLILLLLPKERGVPAGLLVVLLGVGVAISRVLAEPELQLTIAWQLPYLRPLDPQALIPGLVLLALPQLPLSIANAVIATQQTAHDLFPDRPLSIRQIGLTYSLTNLILPFFGGVPLCHGCSGLAGHYALGARTGGAVVIYGSLYLLLGLFFGSSVDKLLEIFPLSILGVILLFEAWVLMGFIKDQAAMPANWMITLLVGAIALSVPQGFLVGTLVGTTLYYLSRKMPLQLS